LKKYDHGAVKSVLRAVRILESFDREEGMTVTEISRRLGLPKSSVHDILSTLVMEGILEKDSDNSRYHLGLKLFELGDKARSSLEIRKVATPFLKSLNSELDETVHLTVLDEGEVLYIECFESTKRLRTYSVIGVRAPLHCTAVGKAIMAFLPIEEVEKIIQKKGLEKFTENTIVDKEKLLDELERIRKRGYAVDNMEHEEHVRCVGAPVFNYDGRGVASISISGPSQRVTEEMVPEIAKMVISTTREISKRLGYKPEVW
jgi:IclR family KDG regulon transcriptional repressor